MVDNFQMLSFIITALGIALSVLSMVFIFLGKKIQGVSGKQQLSYKGLELRTDAVILLICISVSAAIVPLYFQYELQLKNYPTTIADLQSKVNETQAELNKAKEAKKEFNVQGYVSDGESRQPLEGARIRVVRTTVIPPVEITSIGGSENTAYTAPGSLTQTLKFEGPNDKLKLLAEKSGYYSQEIIISSDGVTFPAVLTKKR